MPSDGSLRSNAFQRYWRAGAVSGLGSYITVFALQALVVLVLHGGAAEVGWLNAARWRLFDFERGEPLKKGSRPYASMGVV